MIGINQQIKSTSGGGEGVGFAVPVNAVKRSLDMLREDGEAQYAYLGVSSVELYPQLVDHFHLDVDKGAWTGKSWKYALEQPTNSIGDFNLIDATSGLIIERDDTEGDAVLACAAGAIKVDCFNVPAKFKRIYKVDFAQAGDVPHQALEDRPQPAWLVKLLVVEADRQHPIEVIEDA